MIARMWRGWTTAADAEAYQEHYETEVVGHLRQVAGFRGARLLRTADGDDLLFTSVVYFTSMDDVRGFAGQDVGLAVVEEPARRVLIRWDERVSHHEVVVDLL